MALCINALWVNMLHDIYLLQYTRGVRISSLDNQKIMPVWVLAIIDVILYVVGLVIVIVNGDFSSQGVSYILSLAFAILLFWVANNMKQQAGK